MTLKIITIGLAAIGCMASGCGGISTEVSSGQQPPPITQDSASADTNSDVPIPETPNSATLLHKTYAGSNATLLNPERGFFYWTDLLESDYANARELGYTIIYARVFLKDYVNKPLDDVLLQKIDTAFQNVRKAGVKCILRFSYSDSSEITTDAPLELILQHIAQLKPVLADNVDVIYVVQAGFIGRWGEWHSSTNGLDVNPQARKQVLDAILDALPPSRHIQVRTPMFKDSHVTIGGTHADRIGHHNDCFLASPTDFGTYPDDAIDLWKNSVAADGLLTTVGGETCWINPPRSDCKDAVKELAALHFSFLNGSTGDGVTAGWKTQGCFEEIGQRLGYRLALTTADFNDHIRPGDVLHIKLNLKNDGYSPLVYPRDAYLLLEGGSAYTAKLNIDWTQLNPGVTQSIEANIALPQKISEGTYTLSLWLPDPATTIKNNSQYDIHLANADGNMVTDAIVVDPNAGIYSAEPNATFEAK